MAEIVKQVEATAMVNETENGSVEEREIIGGGEIDEENQKFSFKSFFWHGGSVYDAWFSCASNQVAQVLLTLPYSFSQMGMLSGIILQVFYGIMGSWTAYLISVLYVEYRSRREKEGASFKNHVIQENQSGKTIWSGMERDGLYYLQERPYQGNASLVHGSKEK